MSVYFIRAGNYIKIGYADDPRKRLKELQTGNPNKLELLGSIPGDVSREKEVHHIFSDFRVNGEWFELTTDILAYIHQHKEALPIRHKTVAPKRQVRQEGQGWLEFKPGPPNKKEKRRYYAKIRTWERKPDGRLKKVSIGGSMKGIPSLTQEQYEAYKQDGTLPFDKTAILAERGIAT